MWRKPSGYKFVEENGVMSKKKKGSKKEREARKKLLDKPWWKIKDNWFFVALFLIVILILGLAVFQGNM